MSRRYNAERALETAARNERAAWEAFAAIPPRTRDDVAAAPVVGDVANVRRVTLVDARNPADVWIRYVDTDTGWINECDAQDWARYVRSPLRDGFVAPVPTPLAAAKRAAWERAAARLETARAAVEALPPKGHKRRKDGTVYPVQGPRENAARAAGRAAFNRAAGRAVAFLGVLVAFILLFTSACN